MIKLLTMSVDVDLYKKSVALVYMLAKV